MKDSPTEVKSEVWSYVPQAGFYDEVFNDAAEVRPHWDSLTDSLTRMGAVGLARRWQEGRRLIRENGVTYNVYGDAESTTRPWPVEIGRAHV